MLNVLESDCDKPSENIANNFCVCVFERVPILALEELIPPRI